MDLDTTFANQPIVIDNGSGVIKAGFAGEQIPKLIYPSYVGRPKHKRVMAGAVEGDHFVGPRAEEYRGLLKLRYPMEHGIVNDWGDMERLWQHIYAPECLHTAPEEHPVLLTEAPHNPRRNRERAAEIFFETFGVPALFVSIQAVLSLYASGRTTGVVLDSGDGVTHAVPIYEGFAMPITISRVDLAGRDVTRYLQLQLRRDGYAFRTSAEMETVRAIKEKTCQVAASAALAERPFGADVPETAPFTLPDGTVIQVGQSRFRAAEVLFQPEIAGEESQGVHECLFDAIRKSDLDLRKTLYSTIVLSGGSTLFRGFGERLLSELKTLAPPDAKIKISAPQERKYLTWIGGSILASLGSFRKMWVSKAEYEEEGAEVLHRKTF
eukprot:Opistho-1_new@51595